MVNNPPANAADAGDAGSIPGSGRSPGGGNGNPFQYSRLENSMNRGSWQATVHRGCKESDTVEQLNTHRTFNNTYSKTHSLMFPQKNLNDVQNVNLSKAPRMLHFSYFEINFSVSCPLVTVGDIQ